MMFQVKKNKRGTNSLTVALENVLKEFSLTYYKIEGDSREYCGVANSVLAGRFNDGVEKPKDPYSFFLHCLIGYDSPQHLGGSYLFAQKCIFDWSSIHISNESLPGVIGRNEILQGSTLFSQHHCPRSHIRLSRIKNEFGNPETLHRESKSYTTAAFDSSKERGLTDNTNPEEGIFFIAYHKNPQIIEKIFLNQLGNNDQSSYEDGLLNFFKVDHGNVLYTPSITELIGHSVSALKLEIDLPIKVGAASLSAYHQVRWLKHYKRS
jgi:deferrochelatase/peroxidase EfeB